MRIEHAEVSLIGDREDNQDRVTVAATDKAALMIVIDGMGGHSDGSRAADTALKSLLDSFHQSQHPLFDPLGFLHLSLSKAHDDVARLGSGQSIDARPRATIAICLVQEGAAYWAHVGDSRVYWIRMAPFTPALAITATSNCCCAKAGSTTARPRSRCCT